MQIVIDIPKHIYEHAKEQSEDGYDEWDAMRAIANGKLLPEYHGRLIDADRLTRAEIMHLWYHLPNGDIACPKVDIDHAPTIIEGSDSDADSD